MERTFFSSPYNRVLATVALATLVIALGSYAYYTAQQSKYIYSGPTTISVTGKGEVVAVPDIGQFSFSVIESGVDAETAQASAATKSNDIIAALKAAGVEEKDIKTEYYNLNQKYKYETKPCPFGTYCPGEQVPDGFEVNQTIGVKVRTLDTAGALLAAVGEKGATNISSLEFTVDDTDVLKEEARALAIVDAKEKAKVLAKDLDVRLVKMVGYYENEGGVMPYNSGMYAREMDMMQSDKAMVTPELPTGENTTMSQVTITYQVR